jgi:DNA topoisomerase-3
LADKKQGFLIAQGKNIVPTETGLSLFGVLKQADPSPLLGAAIAGDAGSRPPTPAMKRFADRIAREKGVKPPPGYATTGRSAARSSISTRPGKPTLEYL